MSNNFYADQRTFTCQACGKMDLMRRNTANIYCSRSCNPVTHVGREVSESTRRRLSVSGRGMHRSPATEFKPGEHRGWKFPPGHTSWHKGKHDVYTPEQLARIAEANRRNGLEHRGQDSPHWKGGLPACETCGKGLSGYDRRFCKRHYGPTISGPNSGNWRGGVTSAQQLLRAKFRRTMQPLVLARDNYTCAMCGERGGKLHVDHIQRWKDYPDLRFDMTNCRTLCMACHYYVTFNKKMPLGMVWGMPSSRRIA